MNISLISDKDKSDLINKHLEFVCYYNKTTNLTSIIDINQAKILHIEDSLIALKEINEAPHGLYGDLGTGGGYPGIPLAIYTGRKTLLVDSVKKKIKILDSIITSLSLQDQISTSSERIEELAISKRGDFSVLTARALTSLPSLLELSSPLLHKNGRLIAYKAQITDLELNNALSIQEITGMYLETIREVVLSDNKTHRKIITFTKKHNSKIKLPRQNGLAQRKPLTVSRETK